MISNQITLLEIIDEKHYDPYYNLAYTKDIFKYMKEREVCRWLVGVGMISSSHFLISSSFKYELKGKQQLASTGILLQVIHCAKEFIDVILFNSSINFMMVGIIIYFL